MESHLASSHRAVRVLVSLRASCGSESRTRGPAVAQHKDREMLVGYFSEARRQCRLRATTARRIVGLQTRSRERPVAASELPRKRADGTWRRRYGEVRYGMVRARLARVARASLPVHVAPRAVSFSLRRERPPLFPDTAVSGKGADYLIDTARTCMYVC